MRRDDDTTASARWRALGTTAELVVTDRAALAEARAAVEREVDAIDRACSRFRDDSELTLVNALAGAGEAVEVSRTFAHAVAVALRAARATDGLVDPTLGADLRRAGYDRDFSLIVRTGTVASAPDAGAGGRARAGRSRPRRPSRLRLRPVSGAWRGVEVDELFGTVRVPRGVALDLGATAKALAADEAARAAHRVTGAGVLVSLGGDVAVAGEPPEGGWVVRVADDHAAPARPDRGASVGGARRASEQLILLHGGGLATSGTTVRRWRVGAELRHHLLDPATGAPAETPWRTVSVAAGSCVDANAASTAAIVRGADAPRWLAAAGLPARLVAASGEVVRVAGWPSEDDADAVGARLEPAAW
jgi:thiamine biosynthesis lipoprotein